MGKSQQPQLPGDDRWAAGVRSRVNCAADHGSNSRGSRASHVSQPVDSIAERSAMGGAVASRAEAVRPKTLLLADEFPSPPRWTNATPDQDQASPRCSRGML